MLGKAGFGPMRILALWLLKGMNEEKPIQKGILKDHNGGPPKS